MNGSDVVVEVLPLGREAMRVVNQRAQALAHEAFTLLREQLRIKASEAICAGLDVHSALAALTISELRLAVDGHGFPTPPIGTPSALTQGGNSPPARSLVPGLGESPAFSPVEGL